MGEFKCIRALAVYRLISKPFPYIYATERGCGSDLNRVKKNYIHAFVWPSERSLRSHQANNTIMFV